MPDGQASHDEPFRRWPAGHFDGQAGKAQGAVRVVTEFPAEHVPPPIAGLIVRVSVLVPDLEVEFDSQIGPPLGGIHCPGCHAPGTQFLGGQGPEVVHGSLLVVS